MTTENKTARLDGDDILFMVIGNGSRDNGMSLYHKADANLEKSGDKQSAELLGKVIDHLVKSLALDSKEQSALAYIINGIKASDHPENGSARNMIFKAANALGMHLPSSMFASAGNDRNLRDQIVKLASEHPELREHLVPILKEAAAKYPSQDEAEFSAELTKFVHQMRPHGQVADKAVTDIKKIQSRVHDYALGDKSPWALDMKYKVKWDKAKAKMLGLEE